MNRRPPPLERRPMPRHSRGFTLIEILIVVLIVGILAAIAYPTYSQYVFRARVVPALEALTALSAKLEQRYQDVGGYGDAADGHSNGACGVALPTARNFVLTCVAEGEGVVLGSKFRAVATGSGDVSGVIYSIDEVGVRRTVAHPKGTPLTDCWTIGGGSCDG